MPASRAVELELEAGVLVELVLNPWPCKEINNYPEKLTKTVFEIKDVPQLLMKI